MSKMHSTSLLSNPCPFWTGMLSQESKNDDEKPEKTLLFRVIWLYVLLREVSSKRGLNVVFFVSL